MGVQAGTKLGSYEIGAPLGAGGRGEVYRAKDLSLEREVAIKILTASFSRDTDRLRRFTQEAQATAALHHPNILSVHQIGQQRARVDIGTGKRQLWKTITPAEPSGVFLIAPVIIGVDEKSYGYGLNRRLTDLYVVEGLK